MSTPTDLTIDLTIARAIVGHLEHQIGAGAMARSFVRLEGFSAATYHHLLTALAARQWQIAGRQGLVRSIDPVAGHPALTMEPDRSATWYRNHLPADQTLILILNRRTSDAQSLKDLYGVSEQTLTREGLDALIEVSFIRFQPGADDRDILRQLVRSLRRLRMEPQLRDLTEFLCAVDQQMEQRPNTSLAEAIAHALPAINLFRCRELVQHLNTPRGEKLLHALKDAAQIGVEVLEDRARQSYLQLLEKATLSDDTAFNGLSTAAKRELLRAFIDGALGDHREQLAQVLQIDWSEIKQVIMPRGRESKLERAARVADRLEVSVEQLGLADNDDLLDVIDALRAGRDPESDAVERILDAGGDTIGKALRADLRRLVRPPTRRSADFMVGLTALAIELLAKKRDDLLPGARLRVTLAPGALEDKYAADAASVFQAIYGGLEAAIPAVDWQIDRLWRLAENPPPPDDGDDGDERARLNAAQIGFRLALVNPQGDEPAPAELIWQYRSDSPATATAQALAVERGMLDRIDYGPLFGADAPTLRVPIYNRCQPLDEIGDLDLRHPLSSLGAWYEQPSDLRAELERSLQPVARPAVWAALAAALTALEQAWGAYVLAARGGMLAADPGTLLAAYEGMLATALRELSAGSEVNAAYRLLNQAWLIGATTFESWAIMPVLHPLKLLWWRERTRYFNRLIARLLDADDRATIVDARRLQEELETTYGSSNFPPVLALPPGGGRPAARFLPIEEAQGYELYFHEQAGAEAFGLDTDLLADDENELAARRAVAGIVTVIQDYIETYPFVRDGVEILIFECRNGALPGLLIEQLARTGPRRNWRVRLSVVVHTSSRGASLFRRVSKWVSGAQIGTERSGQDYFPPITVKVLECPPEELLRQHDDTDIVVLADVLAERGHEISSELDPLDGEDAPLEGYLPTYQARQEPFVEGELHRRIMLSAPQQPAVARLFLIAQHAALDRQRRPPKLSHEARFYRDLVLDAWREEIERLHDRFNWVICYDPSIDRFLLQAAFPNKVQVIRYSLGLGAKRQHNLTVSSSGRARSIVTRRLAARLGQMFPQAEVQLCDAIAECLVVEASAVSGDIVLRAAGPGAFLNELIGLVAAKFATEQRYLDAHPGALTSWILLDDFEHWFGGGKFPDMLFVALGTSATGEPLLHLEVLEAKCVGEPNMAVEAQDAQIQVRNGVNRLAPAFAPGNTHLDALYWYDQLYRAIVGNLRVKPEHQHIWEQFRDQLHLGGFGREFSGHSWIFCYDGQAELVDDPAEQPFAAQASEATEVPLFAHHYGRNGLSRLLRVLVSARGGPEAPDAAFALSPVAPAAVGPSEAPLNTAPFFAEEPHLPRQEAPPNLVPFEEEALLTRQEAEAPSDLRAREGGQGEAGAISHHATEESLRPRAGERGTGREGQKAHPTPPTPAAPDAVERQWIGEKARELERSLRRRNIQVLPINAALADVGPSIVRFKLRLSGNETIKKLQATAVDLARDLALIRTPFIDNVLGTNYVGVDLPRERPEIIDLLPLLRGLGHPDSGDLPIIIGKTPDGRMHIDNLADFPHALVAGATGSGKSVFLRSLLLSLITQYQPGRLEILIVDPKQTDFSFFDGLPHLRGGKVFTDASEARDALLELVRSEMPRRQQIMRGRSLKLKDFNQRFPAEALPPIVAMIDEYAQLLSIMNKKDSEQFERDLMSLAAVARATSIHLVLATQRPSVDVVTGTLKANLPTRIAFQVPTNNDSRVVLDAPGAENLLGKGDMLLRRASGEILRLQAPFMSEEAMQAYLVGFRT